MENTQLKTSQDWQQEFPDVIVCDPDGWNRKDYNFSWHQELIPLNEYQRRLLYSTCQFKNNIDLTTYFKTNS